MYLLYGINDYLIKNKINSIIVENKLNKLDISTYELDNNIKDIISDAETLSLFQDKKMIIVNCSNLFKDDLTLLEKYFENINPDTIMIFVYKEEKLDERRKITKLFRNKGTVIELNEATNIFLIVKEMFNEYKIDDNTIKLFIERVGNNLCMLEQEANKLKLYKDNKIINKEDIFEISSKTIEIDLFKLIDSIILKDKNTAMEIYNEMLKQKEEPIAIIITLANQIRIMFQSKKLYSLGYRENEIATTLNIHPFRVKKAREKAVKYTDDILLKYLKQLAELDLKIKKGLIDKDLALELFILEM